MLWVVSHQYPLLEYIKQGVQQPWNDMTPRALRRLYHQMPQGIRLPRHMRGYLTKY